MNEKIYERTFIIMWPFILVVGLVLYFVGGTDITYSFVLGAVSSLMAMSYHYKSITRGMKESPNRIRAISTRNYIIRYLFYILIMAIAYFRNDFDLIFVFVGLISFKFVMFFNILISKKVGDE